MDAVSEVKSRINIEDVVSEYVELKRAGRNFKGLSPFGNEKTPSFMVSPEKQIWHDFSSGKGGNVFSFIMEVEGMSFREALELLARKAGVDLSKYDRNPNKQQQDQRPRLLLMHKLAYTLYQKELMRNEKALKYLRQVRDYSKQTIIDFKIGYAPSDRQFLVKQLLAKGFSSAEIKLAGLGTERRMGLSDIFVDRIVVPLTDPQGQVVGFTGRIIDDNPDAPKYLNTPATPIYDKSRFVFGLDLAKEQIRKTGYVIVVEGNLDVVASHQAGVNNVVAASGTALTQYHLKTLQRFTNDIRLCFDQDKAGQSAAERSILLSQQVGVDVSMISLPSGKDPDELIKQNVDLWKTAVEQQTYMIDWYIQKLESQHDLSSAQGKRYFTDAVLNVVSKINDKVEQEHYQAIIAQKVGTTLETIKAKNTSSLAQTKQRPRKAVKTTHADVSAENTELLVKEQHFLALLVGLQKEDLSYIKNLPPEIFSDQGQKIFSAITDSKDLSTLKNESDYVKMVTLLFEETYQVQETSELQYQLEQLAKRLVTIFAKLKRQEITKQLSNLEPSDKEKSKALLGEAKKIDDLAKQFNK